MSPVFPKPLLPPGQRDRCRASAGWQWWSHGGAGAPPKVPPAVALRASSSEGQAAARTPLWLALPLLFLSNI